MPATRLGELVDIIGGGTPARNRSDYYGGRIPWVTVKDLTDALTISRSVETITEEGLSNSAAHLIPAGTVIVATRMAVGKAMRTTADVAINQDLKALICNSALSPRFLLFLLRARAPKLEAAANGATVKGILIEDLLDIEIPIISVSEQNVIASKLEQVDRLRRMRRYALQMREDFLGAVFLEMFGDPDPTWSCGIVEDLCSVIVDCPHSTPKYVSRKTQYPCIRSSDLQRGELDFGTTKYVDLENYQKRVARLVPQAGDVIYCREGERFGNAAQVKAGQTPCLGQRVMLLRPKPGVTEGTFLLRFLISPLGLLQAQKLVIGTTSPHVNVADIVAFRTAIPPIELQRRFALIAHAVQGEINLCRESLRQAEHLFQTLLHEAFGESQ